MGTCEQTIETTAKFSAIKIPDVGSGEHDQHEPHTLRQETMAKAFPSDSLDHVSPRCSPRDLLRNDETHSDIHAPLDLEKEKREIPSRHTTSSLEDLIEFLLAPQTDPRFAFREPDVVRVPLQGIRRFLPLARRALSTARPWRVAIRARNPCVLARWSRLGW